MPSAAPRPATQDLAFIRDGNLWLAAVDASGAIRLTHDGRDAEPQWSPDGGRLVFIRGSGAAAELYVVDANGGPPRRLTSDGLEQRNPRWAPRGGLIAYVQPTDLNGNGVADPAENLDIWLVREDGTGQRKIADGFDPAWSADGLRLAYATNGMRPSSGPAPPSENAVHLVNAQGQNNWELLPIKAVPQDLERSHNFPFRPSTRWLRSPSWAADGHHISASADGHTGLALTVDDGGAEVKVWVLNYEGGVGRSLFAPKGTALAVESRPASGYAHVLVVDTASERKVDIGSEKEDYSAIEPTWSPDGGRLAVITFGGVPEAPSGTREVLVFSAADGLVRSRAAAGNVRQPAWNPTR